MSSQILLPSSFTSDAFMEVKEKRLRKGDETDFGNLQIFGYILLEMFIQL